MAGAGYHDRLRFCRLGLDENNCPVILEYKRSVGENVINQGLFYLDWLMDHQAEFKLLVMDKLRVTVRGHWAGVVYDPGMALLSDSLTVWEIAFRWAGRDPRTLWLRIPLNVQDHVRNMMDAILSAELPCESITLEKRPFEPDEKKFSVYHWIDDIYLCIWGHHFNRKLLRHASIDRYDFMLWCERRNIPLPEFWFPPGWNLEYVLPEGDIHPGYYYLRRDWTREDWAAWHMEQEQAEAGSGGGGECSQAGADQVVGTTLPDEDRSPTAEEKAEESAEKLRPSQNAKIACQQIALAIWKESPDRTITSVVKDELIQKYGGAAPYVDATVREWVKVVAPTHVRGRRGRPKNGGEGE